MTEATVFQEGSGEAVRVHPKKIESKKGGTDIVTAKPHQPSVDRGLICTTMLIGI